MKKILLTIALIALPFLYLKRIHAQTLPGTYTQTTMVTGLNYPVDFDWAPDGRYFITQKGGNNAGSCAEGKIVVYSAAGALLSTFWDFTDSVNCDFERGLLGIAIDPGFATNKYVYAYYVHKYGSANSIRIVRFTEASNLGTNPTIILNINVNISPTPPGNHFGGMIRFRPSQSDKLYFCIGDLAYSAGNPTLNYANKLTNPFGKILRINSNGTIPSSNPFYDDGNPATGNDDRIWAYGVRNGFGMCFNPVTDSMYYSENGANTWDEFDIIHKGANYGWTTCEGNYLYGSTSSPCTNPSFVDPIAEWGSPLPSVTGCVFYSGSVMPEFNNHILVADNDYGRIYNLTMGNAPAYNTVTSNTVFADITSSGGLTALRQGPDGCIYAMKGGYTTNGQIYKICPTGTGISSNIQLEHSLGQNYPNPVNGKTEIDYSISQPGFVSIELYDLTGRIVKTIFKSNTSAGKHTVDVNGLASLADGSYFYKMEVKQSNKTVYTETKRMMIVR